MSRQNNEDLQNAKSAHEPNEDQPNEVLKSDSALLLDHDYDGIRELDYPLPNWWLATFFATIIFSFLYVIHYWTGAGPTPEQELVAELEEIKALGKTTKVAADRGPTLDDDLVLALKDPNRLGSGKTIFIGKCAPCHGPNAEGGIGPNLADNYWLNGDGKPATVAYIIRDGVAAKGMPPWGSVLKSNELADVAAFIESVKGIVIQNAKPPQGTKVE